jgi:hypothetical protein
MANRVIIEIADYIFAHPDKKMSDVLSFFVGKYRKNERTIERYIKQAKEYNKERIQKQEKAKDEVLVAEAKEAIKEAILSRDECLAILSEIAKGKERVMDRQTLVPSDSERTRAITVLADMQGWDAPVKSEIETNSFFSFLMQTGVVEDDEEQY